MKRICVIALILALSVCAWAVETESGIGHDQALTALMVGNARYVAGTPQVWSAGQDKRDLLSQGQHPVACVITCSDSRVSPEILFDQSLGDIFVIRLAGNVVTPEAVGSAEYAIEHLHVPLVVVLGHTSCGAIAAAMAEPDLTGPIGTIVSRIKPSVEIAKLKGFIGDDLSAAVAGENARRGTQSLLECSRAIEEAVNKGDVAVLSAIYDIQSGKVNWQTQLCAPVQEIIPVAATPAPSEEKTAVSGTATEKDKPVATTNQKSGDKPVATKKRAKEPTFYAGRH
jgi:carbonic anhydrase